MPLKGGEGAECWECDGSSVPPAILVLSPQPIGALLAGKGVTNRRKWARPRAVMAAPAEEEAAAAESEGGDGGDEEALKRLEVRQSRGSLAG